MTHNGIPIRLHSRIAAGLLGIFILGAGLWFTAVMWQRGWWLMVGLGLLVALGASPVFLDAAYTGFSPRWPDEQQGPAA